MTHRYRLDDIVDAYDPFSHQRDGVLKVAVTPWSREGSRRGVGQPGRSGRGRKVVREHVASRLLVQLLLECEAIA